MAELIRTGKDADAVRAPWHAEARKWLPEHTDIAKAHIAAMATQ